MNILMYIFFLLVVVCMILIMVELLFKKEKIKTFKMPPHKNSNSTFNEDMDTFIKESKETQGKLNREIQND